MKSWVRFIGLFICFVVLTSWSSFPAASIPQEKQEDIKVRLRLIPVTVLEGKGPVKGLKLEDFELLVDGKPMEIRSVDEYDYSSMRQAVRAGKKPNYTGVELPARRILLVFDLLSSGIKGYQDEAGNDTGMPTFEASQRSSSGDRTNVDRIRGIRASKDAAKKWVEKEVLPSDEVAIVTYNLAPLMLQPYTKNKKSLMRAIESITLPQDVIGPDLMSEEPEFEMESKFSLHEMQIAQMSKAYLGFYQRLGKLLTALPGTKQVILFSEGISMHQDLAGLSLLPELEKATNALSSSNSRISAVSITNPGRQRTGSFQDEFLNSLANETGGEYYPSRSRVDGMLRDAGEAFDHFYELSFSPAVNESTGFHTVEVRVKKDRVRTTAPPGYLGERSYDKLSAEEQELKLTKGFWKSLMANDLGAELAMRVLPYAKGKAALHIRSLIPVAGVAEGLRTNFDVLFTLGIDGESFDKGKWRAQGKATSSPLQLDVLLPLPNGQSSFQFALRDRKNGDSAYMMNGVSVPDKLPQVTISPVFFIDPDSSAPPTRLTEREKPKKLTTEIPKLLSDLVNTPSLAKFTGGKKVKAAMIFKGPKFDQFVVHLKKGDTETQFLAKALTEKELADGLRLIEFLFTVPNWPSGECDITFIYGVKGKYYMLTKETVNLE